MILVKGKLLTVEEKDNKGYKYLNLIIESSNVRYPHIVKCHFDDDYKKYVDKSGIISFPLYLTSWDSVNKKFTSRGVNLSLLVDKS